MGANDCLLSLGTQPAPDLLLNITNGSNSEGFLKQQGQRKKCYTSDISIFNSGDLEYFQNSACTNIEEGWRQKQRQISSHLFRGQNVFNSLPL